MLPMMTNRVVTNGDCLCNYVFLSVQVFFKEILLGQVILISADAHFHNSRLLVLDLQESVLDLRQGRSL